MKFRLLGLFMVALVSVSNHSNAQSSKQSGSNLIKSGRVYSTDDRDRRVFHGDVLRVNAGYLTTNETGLWGGAVTAVGFTIKADSAKPAKDFVPALQTRGNRPLFGGMLMHHVEGTDTDIVGYIALKEPSGGGVPVYITVSPCPALNVITTHVGHLGCPTQLLGYLLP